MAERKSGDYADLPLERIGDLLISPETDIPFGKRLRMGLVDYTIYDKATENGYYAGAHAHEAFIKDHDNCDPVILDDAQFVLVLDAYTPQGMTEHNAGVWRASFIAGWVAVCLGVYTLERPDR